MSDEYSETDMDAFRRAMEIAMREPDRKRQLESKINGGARRQAPVMDRCGPVRGLLRARRHPAFEALGMPAVQRVR